MNEDRPFEPNSDPQIGGNRGGSGSGDKRPKRRVKYGSIFDPDISLRENWKEAYPLNEAWWLLCDEEQREEYRNSGNNEAKSTFLEKMIKSRILDFLFYDKLVALGFLVSPLLENEPSQIPPTFFRHEYRQVDWEASVVEGPGRRYEQVTLCRAAPADNAAANANANADQVAMPPPPSGGKRGRTRDDRYFEEAVRTLISTEPLFFSLMQEAQIVAIREAAASANRGRYPGSALPGRSTVARFVKYHRAAEWRDFQNPENPENP